MIWGLEGYYMNKCFGSTPTYLLIFQGPNVIAFVERRATGVNQNLIMMKTLIILGPKKTAHGTYDEEDSFVIFR